VIAFLALLRDTVLEARDKRVTWFLLLLGLLFVVLCGSISFTAVDADAALTRVAGNLGEFRFSRGMLDGGFTSRTEVEVAVTAPRAPQPEDDLPLGIDSLRVVELGFRRPEQLDELAVTWRHFAARLRRDGGRGPFVVVAPGSDEERQFAAPVTAAEQLELLESRFLDAGFRPVLVRRSAEQPGRFLVAVGNERPLALRGACTVAFGFGSWSTPLAETSQAEFLAALSVVVADSFAGFIGILVLLSVFAAAFPELLQKGRFDLVLARPIGRVRIVLFKYLGAVLLVLLLWTLLFAGCAVAMGLATGYWKFRLVGCAMTCTLLFAALYPAAMAVGIATRHVTLSTLAGVGAWGLERLIETARGVLQFADAEARARWQPLLDGVHAVLPKAGELARLNQWLLASDHLGAASASRLLGVVPEVDWAFAGGSTAGFAAVLLGLACLLVARRDF